MTLWNLNGFNALTGSHAFNWSGSTAHQNPPWRVECGCGNFVLLPSGKVERTEYLKRIMAQAAAFDSGGAKAKKLRTK